MPLTKSIGPLKAPVSETFRRGVLIAPSVEEIENGFSLAEAIPFEKKVRFSAMYFDLAAIATNNLFGSGYDADQRLISTGFFLENYSIFSKLQGNLLDGRPGMLGNLVSKGLENLPLYACGGWSVLYDNPEAMRRPSTPENYDTIFIDIMSTFPVPNVETPIEEIIAFNAKNRQALTDLRAGVSVFCERLATSINDKSIFQSVRTDLLRNLEFIEKKLKKSSISATFEDLSIGVQCPSDVIEVLMNGIGIPSFISTPLSNLINVGFGRSFRKSFKSSIDISYAIKAKSTFKDLD